MFAEILDQRAILEQGTVAGIAEPIGELGRELAIPFDEQRCLGREVEECARNVGGRADLPTVTA
jgi:hypothetical protein